MLLYLCLDVGGTNCRIDLMEIRPELVADGPLPESSSAGDELLLAQAIYPTQQYSSVNFVINKFLTAHCPANEWPICCCIVVAGPVSRNRAAMTNVNWTIDGESISKELKIPKVQVLNDFVGIGYGILALDRSGLVAINDIPLLPESPKAVIGAGTGLGEAFLTFDGSEYSVSSSEGGHCDFAPRDDREFRLLEFLLQTQRVTRVSVERIVSGTGIPHIYEYFCSLHPEEVSDEVQMKLRLTADPGSVISEYAKSGECSLCVQTIQFFIRCYGAEAGNLALKILPFGGLYIAGGIAPKLKWAMEKDNEFWQNFINKGRMRGLLERVPVFLVVHSQPGLLGAKVVARRMIRAEGFSIKGELVSFNDAAPKSNGNASLSAIEAAEHRSNSKANSGSERAFVRARRNSTKNNSAFREISPSVLVGSAFIGGLVASIATVVISSWIGKSNKFQK